MKKVGVIAIIITRDRASSVEVQKVLSDYGDIIIGRLGVPDRENNIYCISVVVEGENEAISALAGKLGRIPNVNVKSALTSVEVE